MQVVKLLPEPPVEFATNRPRGDRRGREPCRNSEGDGFEDGGGLHGWCCCQGVHRACTSHPYVGRGPSPLCLIHGGPGYLGFIQLAHVNGMVLLILPSFPCNRKAMWVPLLLGCLYPCGPHGKQIIGCKTMSCIRTLCSTEWRPHGAYN